MTIETGPRRSIRFEITRTGEVYLRANSGTKRIRDPELIAQVHERHRQIVEEEEKKNAERAASVSGEIRPGEGPGPRDSVRGETEEAKEETEAGEVGAQSEPPLSEG